MIIDMKKILNVLMIACLLMAYPVVIQAEEKETLEILSETAVLVDADNKSVLYNHKANEKMYPASITKILTVLIAIENLPPGQEITVNKSALSAVEAGSSHIALTEGEVLTAIDLWYATLLASANDGANVLAEAVSGNMDEFCKKMTSRAKEMGALNTNFTNPSGLPDDNHYTTAYDMALITAEAIKNEQFLEIFSTVSYTASPTNKQKEPRVFANGTNMIKKGADHYEFAIGGKTGWTSVAEYTLVTYAKRDNLNLIAVVMKSPDRASSYQDTKNMFDDAFDKFHKILFDKELIETKSGEIYAGKYLHAKYTTSIQHDFGLLLPLNVTKENVRFEVEMQNENDVELINAKLNIYINEKLSGELPMVVEKQVYDISFKNTTLKEIIKVFNYFCMGVLGLSLLALLARVMRNTMNK